MKKDEKKIEIVAKEDIVAKEKIEPIGGYFIADVYGSQAGYFDLPLFEQERINGYSKVIVSPCKGSYYQPELDNTNIKVCNVVPQENRIWIRLYISDQIEVFRLHVQIFY